MGWQAALRMARARACPYPDVVWGTVARRREGDGVLDSGSKPVPSWGLLALLVVTVACGGDEAPIAPARPSAPAESPSTTTTIAPAPTSAATPTYVGRTACAECHAEETRRFTGSHHDLAMAVADETTVVGDFADATFTHGDVTTRFFRRDGKYWVRTDGPGGTPAEYEVAYTFGIDPLQQYLVPMAGGRYQALGVAWDSRPKADGGQRWFHLYGEEPIPHDDVLHWTKPSQNWNDRCARCHSTDLRKNYDLASDSYRTTWAEIDVSCEACHGPASAHVAWARGGAPTMPADKGLVALRPAEPAAWVFDGTSAIAHRTPARTEHAEIETCAPCHARRAELTDTAVPGAPLLDGYVPALLTQRLYFADGQIEDEVYEWGSFLQSRMFAAGVTCSDCHDPHSLRLRADGNAVCAQCHMPARFDTPSHHFHPAGSPGAQCVACHMPARTYMRVDVRHDHGFRIPRPDLDATLGTPDACTACHTDRTPAWAAEAINRQRGIDCGAAPTWATAIAAGRRGAVGAADELARLAQDAARPAIVRATALDLLSGEPGPTALAAIEAAAASDAPALLRLGAMDALGARDPRTIAALAGPRLDDPLRAIRTAAALALAGEPATLLPPDRRAAFERGLNEYRAAQRGNADRPESHLNLGVLALRLGDVAGAEAEFQIAVQRWPYFIPAAVNLADVNRLQQRDAEGETVLRAALALVPDSAEGHHALGLLLVRRGRRADALAELERASALAPDEPRYAYVLGVALASSDQRPRALEVLRAAHERRPGDAEIVFALATMSRDAGALDDARRWAEMLVTLLPGDPQAAGLRDELTRGR